MGGKGDIPVPCDRPGRKRTGWLFAFWCVNGALLALALAVRFATPQVVLTPIAYLRPTSLSVTNICQHVSSHIVEIQHCDVRRKDTTEFDMRIINLDNYMSRVMRRLPEYSEGVYELDFITSVYALRQLTSKWRDSKKQHTAEEASILQVRLLSLKAKFNKVKLRKRRPAPLWYMHIARISMGLTEGMLAPVFVGWRSMCGVLRPGMADAQGALSISRRRSRTFIDHWANGDTGLVSLRLSYIFAPRDWRRDSILFALFFLYGAMLCGYVLMVAAQKVKWNWCQKVFVLIAILVFGYGIVSFSAFMTRYNAAVDAWYDRQVSGLLSNFDFIWSQK